MKKLLYRLILLLPFLFFWGCSDDDNAPQNPINQLPEATQTGENTFGCLLDGEAFIPGGGTNPLDFVYQFVDGGYYFQLQGRKRNDDFNLISINLITRAKEIEEGETYLLLEEALGNASGIFGFNGGLSFTSIQNSGQLTITHLDMNNQIVSGTFWFDVIDHDGNLRKIREGRFDMEFTQ
ncbi:hypothetical protein [Psychroflexus aestuariivivens]|uniref:hypothetical protein n=1 Tax=Psychroflexus aestuariivivens TaxID=1795040 RepID=UPI000FD725C8|nr:hypothetical protein [Psychroflexus aestuariivivens]